MAAVLPSTGECFELASRTHPGVVREVNEDHCATFVAEDCAGLVVADGVSSFHGGDTASRVAVEVTLSTFLADQARAHVGKRLQRAVQRANIVVHDQALDVPELRSMATTLTAVVLRGDELSAVHVGDCRLYLLRDGALQQITRDHTVSAERMRLGVLSKARARKHPERSTLTRCLGRDLMVRADRISVHLLPRDVLVVVSDGIHVVLEDSEIAAICREPSAELVCENLISAANQRGSPDNVTAAVARVSGDLRVTPKTSGLFRGLWDKLGNSG